MIVKVMIRVHKYENVVGGKYFYIYYSIYYSNAYFNIQALVWLMTGILVASLCSALVQHCDNCDTDHFKNKL